MGAILVEQRTHPGNRLGPLRLLLDPLQLALQIDREVGIIVLPIMLEDAPELDPAGPQPARRRARAGWVRRAGGATPTVRAAI